MAKHRKHKKSYLRKKLRKERAKEAANQLKIEQAARQSKPTK